MIQAESRKRKWGGEKKEKKRRRKKKIKREEENGASQRERLSTQSLVPLLTSLPLLLLVTQTQACISVLYEYDEGIMSRYILCIGTQQQSLTQNKKKTEEREKKNPLKTKTTKHV